MTDGPLVSTCTGRPVTREGQPYGDPCGAIFKHRMSGGWQYVPINGGGVEMVWLPPQPIGDDAYRNAARTAGWSIGPGDVAMCPRCRRPDPEAMKICRELRQSIGGP